MQDKPKLVNKQMDGPCCLRLKNVGVARSCGDANEK